MRPTGTTQQLERRRRKAIAMLKQGYGGSETARKVGVTPAAVSQWKKAYQRLGEQALKAHSPPGRCAKLSARQRGKLEKLLLKGARNNGYCTELWTLSRIVELIHKKFGVGYDPSGVWHLLHRMGWSCQKPERRARERNEAAIAAWRKYKWPHIKKSPQKRS